MLEAALQQHHRPPGLALIFILIALGVLYVAWRTRWLGRLRTLLGVSRMRRELQGYRISPVSLIPLAVLVIVVVVLVVEH